MAGDASDQRRHLVVTSKGPAKESATDDASVEHTPRLHRINPANLVTTLGVVFGDLGTSPLKHIQGNYPGDGRHARPICRARQPVPDLLGADYHHLGQI